MKSLTTPLAKPLTRSVAQLGGGGDARVGTAFAWKPPRQKRLKRVTVKYRNEEGFCFNYPGPEDENKMFIPSLITEEKRAELAEFYKPLAWSAFEIITTDPGYGKGNGESIYLGQSQSLDAFVAKFADVPIGYLQRKVRNVELERMNQKSTPNLISYYDTSKFPYILAANVHGYLENPGLDLGERNPLSLHIFISHPMPHARNGQRFMDQLPLLSVEVW